MPNKRYELLKEAITYSQLIPSGLIVEYNGSRQYHSSGSHYIFEKEFVEDNPTLFREIKDKEEVFTWDEINDAINYEIANHRKHPVDSLLNIKKRLRQSKQPDLAATNTKGYETGKERMEVTKVWRASGGISNLDGKTFHAYHFNSVAEIPKEKLPAIKAAIERILNDDDDNKFWETIQHHTDKAIDEVTKHKFTQEQMDKAIRDAFEESRVCIDSYKGNKIIERIMRYSTFQNYLNSLKTKPA